MIEALSEKSVEIMNVAIQLRSAINDSSITMKEYQPIKALLTKLDNLSSDVVSIAINIKEK